MQSHAGPFRFGAVERVGRAQTSQSDKRARKKQRECHPDEDHPTGEAHGPSQHIADSNLFRRRLRQFNDQRCDRLLLHALILLHASRGYGMSTRVSRPVS